MATLGFRAVIGMVLVGALFSSTSCSAGRTVHVAGTPVSDEYTSADSIFNGVI